MSLALDARQYGNIARFIRKADVSKGESPNLHMQVIISVALVAFLVLLGFVLLHSIIALNTVFCSSIYLFSKSPATCITLFFFLFVYLLQNDNTTYPGCVH
jgi:uncharacterized RDD family membrane protein YckC